LKSRNNDVDIYKHIHVTWVCISELSEGLFEKSEIDLIFLFSKELQNPVIIIVIKENSDDNELKDKFTKLFPNININKIQVLELSDGKIEFKQKN